MHNFDSIIAIISPFNRGGTCLHVLTPMITSVEVKQTIFYYSAETSWQLNFRREKAIRRNEGCARTSYEMRCSFFFHMEVIRLRKQNKTASLNNVYRDLQYRPFGALVKTIVIQAKSDCCVFLVFQKDDITDSGRGFVKHRDNFTFFFY
jgi:hypothetical protein